MFVDVPARHRVARQERVEPDHAGEVVDRLRQISLALQRDKHREPSAGLGVDGARERGRCHEHADAHRIEDYTGEGLQERPEAHLVPGLRRLRRRAGDLPRAGRHRPPAARDRLRLRHRLLEPHPRLHDGLRLQHRARPRAADRAGHQAGQPRAAGARGRRRRRRLLDRRRPRRARDPPQHRPHLHRDGQPDLRPDQGPAVADVPRGAARPSPRTYGSMEEPGQPAALRARLRRRASSRRARRPT